MKASSALDTVILVTFYEHFTPKRVAEFLPALSGSGRLETLSLRQFIIRASAEELEKAQRNLNRLNKLGCLTWAEIDPDEAKRYTPLREYAELPPTTRPEQKDRVPVIKKKPKKKINISQKRELAGMEMRQFAKEYARKAQKGQEPNDRGYNRDLEKRAKRMKPAELDKLLRDED